MPSDTKDNIETAERLVRIETLLEALRADLARYFAELTDHEKRLRTVESSVTTHTEKLKHISRQASTWNLGNSIGAGIAAAIAWFK